MKLTWVGTIATLLTGISLIPVVYKATIQKSTHSISYLYIVLGIMAQIFWFIHALANRDLHVLVLSIYLISIYSIIAIVKFYYEKNKLDVYSQLKDEQ